MEEAAAVAVAAALAVTSAVLRLRGAVGKGRRLAVAVLAGVLVLLLIQPFPGETLGTTPAVRVIVIDVSASMGRLDEVLQPGAWGQLGSGRVVLVACGNHAELLHDGLASALPERATLPSSLLARHQRTRARLDLALGLVAARLGGLDYELTVLSDGGFDAAAASLAVSGEARPLAVRLVAPPSSTYENAAIRFVTPPTVVGEDESVAVELEVRGRVLEPRRVVVTVGGVAPREAVLTPSRATARLGFTVSASAVDGSLIARLDSRSWDGEPEDDRAELPFLRREAAPRVMLSSTAEPSASAALASALGVSVRRAPDLDAADVLVLHEFDAASAPFDDERLRDFVGSGGGLLLAGGRRSFGLGDWEGTVLDALSPLASRPSGRRVVTVALDRSGSMDREGRFASAAAAVVELARRLGGDDRLRLIPFGTTARVHELEGEGAAERARDILSRVRPDGGTDVGRALDLAFDFDGGDAESVVLVLSDFRDARAMRTENVERWRRRSLEGRHHPFLLWFDRDETLRPLLLRLVDGDASRIVPVEDFGRLLRPMLDSAGRSLVLEEARVDVGGARQAVLSRLIRTTTRPEAKVRASHSPTVAALAEVERGAGRVAAAPAALDADGIAALFGDEAGLRRFVHGLGPAPAGDVAVFLEEHEGGWLYRVRGGFEAVRLRDDRGDHELGRVGREERVSEELAAAPRGGAVLLVGPKGETRRAVVAAPDFTDTVRPVDVLKLPLRAPAGRRPLVLMLTAFAIFLMDGVLRLFGR